MNGLSICDFRLPDSHHQQKFVRVRLEWQDPEPERIAPVFRRKISDERERRELLGKMVAKKIGRFCSHDFEPTFNPTETAAGLRWLERQKIIIKTGERKYVGQRQRKPPYYILGAT